MLKLYPFAKRSDDILETEAINHFLKLSGTYSVLAGPLRNSKGEPWGAIETIHDITDRKRAEEALRESEIRFKSLVEQCPISIMILDTTGKTVQINKAFENLWGVNLNDLREYNILHDRQLENLGVLSFIQRGFSGETSALPIIEYDGIASINKGNKRWVRATIYPVKYSKEYISNVILMQEDITEQKHIEDALRFTRFTIEHSADSIVWIVPDGKIVDVNETACNFLGYSRDEFLTLSISDIDIFYTNELREQYWNDIRAKGSITIEARQRKRDGKEVDVEVTSSYLKYNGKEYVCSFIRDITQRKEAEEKRRHLEEQLIQAQKMESVGRLAGGVAHDFNNILSVIIGYGELLQKNSNGNSSAHQYLNEILSAAERATDLTRQLLAFSRKQLLNVKTLDLNKIIQEMSKMIQRLLGEDIKVQLHLEAGLQHIKGDMSQLEQVLLNLCINARDAMPSGGILALKTTSTLLDDSYTKAHPGTQTGQYALLTVSDTGVGMDEKVRSRIFEPFFSTKEQGKGTGLGLSTVYGIVKQHGGEISVYSELGHGTTFRVYLPLADDISTEDQKPVEEPTLRGEGEVILVAEDEVAVRSLVCHLLTQLGYYVLEATTLQDCLQYASTKSIDLLLTDVIMPEINGRELHDRIASLHPNIKTLYMSGYTEDVIGQHGMLDEGINFITKPFTEKELAKKVRQVIKGS